jgi:glycosyltransferase involved in cell wall biosynthesis
MKVDVMVPFYGDPALLRLSVRSVLEQDDPDWRLVVVDDGYPDPEVAEWFATLDDDRVEYRRNEVNLGANGNFRRCLDLVRNDLVVLMGADDLMLPGYIAAVKDLRSRYPGAAVFQVGVQCVDETGAAFDGLVDRAKQALYAPGGRGPRLLGGEALATSLLRGNWLYFPSLAWRSDAVLSTGFRDGLDVVQDLALVLDLLVSGEQLVVDDRTCFRYRRHRASDSSTRALSGSRFAEEREYFLAIAREMGERGWHRAARAARHHLSSRLHALSVVPRAVRSGRAQDAGRLLQHAFARGVRS